MAHEGERQIIRGRPVELVRGLRAAAYATEPRGPHFDYQGIYDQSGVGGRLVNSPPYVVICMDDGLIPDLHPETTGRGIVRASGSGIRYTETLLEIVRFEPYEIVDVFSHPGCGAAAEHASQNELTSHPDEIGDTHARVFAGEIGARYAGRIPINGRHPKLHAAKTVYFNDDPGFEATRVSGLPAGFGISRWLVGPDAAAYDAELAVTIANSDSGLGAHSFTPERPLYLVAVAASSNMKKVVAEIEEIRDASQYRENIKTTTIVTRR